jgi:NAD(P)-dependent dehydrogenase (short-subunit alcohol dehydrogenase family)
MRGYLSSYDICNFSESLLVISERRSKMRLKGKVAIVTGSGSGIGKATVMLMARKGASVVVNDINVEGIDKVVSEIKKEGGTAIGFKADVTKRSEVRDLMKTAVEKFGQIHILVNNAGIVRRGSFLELTEEDWDSVLAVNLKGEYNCIQAVAPYMMQQRYGKIVNISSAAATGIFPGLGGATANYAASKTGVIQLTKSAARELGPYGINVNCVAPGSIITPMTFTTRTKEEVEKHLEQRRKSCVLNRSGGPEDIANLVLFLSSDESSFISGQLICCDGGRTDRM